MIKNFIFDLDGTLIDSAHDIRRVLIDSIKSNGFNLPDNVFIPVGPTLERITKMLIPSITDEMIKKILEDYRERYLTGNIDKTVPFEGIMETLKFIKNSGHNCFIATFKPRIAADFFAKKFFSALYIDCITPNDLPSFDNKTSVIKSGMLKFLISKWNLKPQDCIMIGDSESDIAGGKEAGIKTISALYGYGRDEELKTADIKVKNSSDLINIIRQLVKE